MDKKKLIEYTEWLLKYKLAALTTPKIIVKDFLRQNPTFFAEPDPVKESFDELFEARENQSQTGSFEITFKITK